MNLPCKVKEAAEGTREDFDELDVHESLLDATGESAEELASGG